MEQVIWRRHLSGGGKDRTGKRIPAETEDIVLDRCQVAPSLVNGVIDITRDGEIRSYDLFVERRDIAFQRNKDHVKIRGEWFLVSQTPFSWTPRRRRRANHGTRVLCLRQEG